MPLVLASPFSSGVAHRLDSLVFPFPFTDTVLCPLRSVLRLLLLLKALGFTGLLAFGLLFGLLFSISNIFVVEMFKFVCSTLTGDESC